MIAGIKKIIILTDRKIFRGGLSRLYLRCMKSHGEQIYNIKSLIGRRFHSWRVVKEGSLSVRDIILAQYYNNDFSHYKYEDLAVRYMAIENYYGKYEDNRGFELYQKLQEHSGFNWTDRYKNLIASYAEGYDEGSKIELDKDLNIMDGAHRLALALYHNQEFINVTIHSGLRNREYGDVDAFWKLGFSRDETAVIEKKTEELLESLHYSYIGVIWPPAMKYKDEIIDDLNRYDPQIKVSNVRDMECERGEFVHLFKGLYHTDILDDYGANRKINLIEESMTDEEKKKPYHICVFELNISNPHIGINPKNYQTQSLIVKRIKTTFRKRYAPKILNYKYDVMMHISDNYIQSKFCQLLLNMNRDVSDFFDEINDVPYVIIRAKESRQHSEFPKKFYFRSDVDIITRNAGDMLKIADSAYRFAQKHFTEDWISLKTIEDKEVVKVKVYMLDFMVFQFEILQHIFGLDDDFRDECFKHRIKDSYYYLPDSDEVMIRVVELCHKPKKTWYLQYITEHFSELDQDKLYAHLNKKEIKKQKVEKLIHSIASQQEKL